MKKLFFSLLIAIVAIAIAVPLIFGKDVLEYLSSFAMIVSTLAAILTAVIAILLYDRFSAERDLLSKQFENVSKLVENLRINGVRVRVQKGHEEMHYYDILFSDRPHSWFEELQDSSKSFLDYPMLISVDAYSRLLSIFDGISSFYLPKEIYQACMRFVNQIGGGAPQCLDIYTKVLDFLPRKGKDNKESEWSYEIPFKLPTLIKDLDYLYEAIEKWLTDHSIDNVDVRGTDFNYMKLTLESQKAVPRTLIDREVPTDSFFQPIVISHQSDNWVVQTDRYYLKTDRWGSFARNGKELME